MDVWEGRRENKLLCAEGLLCTRINALTDTLSHSEFQQPNRYRCSPILQMWKLRPGEVRDSHLGAVEAGIEHRPIWI